MKTTHNLPEAPRWDLFNTWVSIRQDIFQRKEHARKESRLKLLKDLYESSRGGLASVHGVNALKDSLCKKWKMTSIGWCSNR